jgi:5-methylcytosine-specific restriction protein A
MFSVSEKYNRANDIHDKYGGGRQSGISASASHPFIFLFTGDSGKSYGYEDGWQPEEGVFLYTGQGQAGDMEFSRGNKAIRDHVKDGKQLLLFKALGKGRPVEFMGEFECASIGSGKATDVNGDMRDTIRFNLTPLGQALNQEAEELSSPQKTLEELRLAAFQAISPPETKDWRSAKQIRRQRSNEIKAYVLKRANGICELTGSSAPFVKSNGEPFLEVHHIKRLSDGGLDHPANCSAITPNAHREIHYGAHGAALDEKLAQMIAEKERSLPN